MSSTTPIRNKAGQYTIPIDAFRAHCPIKGGPKIWGSDHDDPTIFSPICWSGLAESIINGHSAIFVDNLEARRWAYQYKISKPTLYRRCSP